jgi:hypothetical protein
MSNKPINLYAGAKANYVVGGNELNEVIEHLNDLFVGKPMTKTEMDLLQHIVNHICNMANENQLLKIYNQEQIKPYSSNH